MFCLFYPSICLLISSVKFMEKKFQNIILYIFFLILSHSTYTHILYTRLYSSFHICFLKVFTNVFIFYFWLFPIFSELQCGAIKRDSQNPISKAFESNVKKKRNNILIQEPVFIQHVCLIKQGLSCIFKHNILESM